jgi:hypothetical protein
MTKPVEFTAELFGPSWAQAPVSKFSTIQECRNWAEEYGTTANACTIRNNKGRVVGRHVRDPHDNGLRWFVASYK